MIDIFGTIVVAATGYLLGSIPFAVIVAKICGVDIFKAGSGNPGATNVKRTCGKIAGDICFFLDALKGFIAASIPIWAPWCGVQFTGSGFEYLKYVGFVAAIVGHMFPLFAHFHGGKGVATSIGGLCAIMIWPIIIGVVLWIAVFYSTRYVSLASIVLALSLPASSYLVYGWSSVEFWFAMVLGLVIIYRHRSNISRLIAGKENRF